MILELPCKLAEIGVGLVGVIADGFAIEDAGSTDDDAIFIEEIQGVVRRQAAPGRSPEPHHLLVGFALEREPGFGISAVGVLIAPAVKGDAVEFEVNAVDRPFAEAESGVRD